MTPSPVDGLRLGSRSAAVGDVCAALLVTGDLAWPDAGTPPRSWPGSAGGYGEVEFNESVERAVRSFQQRRGLRVDGVVGASTYAVLDGARWSLGDRVLRYVPGHAIEGDDVAALQARLLELGFSPGKVDGIHGRRTDRAVGAFQSATGLDADGTVGPDTLRAFAGLRRSVVGGSANALREREHIRLSGHSLSGRTIVLDPGHGGHDRGACGNRGLVEAELALELAHRIEGRLSAQGVSVVFTRTEATTAGSDEDRASFANSVEADLLLSLHSDHSASGAAHGVSTYFYGHADHRDQTGHPHSGWSVIGERFADLLLREVAARTKMTDCRAHARTWPILRRTRMPAVSLDFGYLDHEGDAAALADDATIGRMAEGVVVALQRLYLGDTDTTRTGVLRLDDLRRHLEAARAEREQAAAAAATPWRHSATGT